MNDVTLLLKAKHFKNADYCSNTDCPVARAIKEQMDTVAVKVFPSMALVGDKIYALDYGALEFNEEDMPLATMAKFSAIIIRELPLTLQ